MPREAGCRKGPPAALVLPAHRKLTPTYRACSECARALGQASADCRVGKQCAPYQY